LAKNQYLSPGEFRFFAHRGLCVAADGSLLDENTSAAFERALAVGATHLEIDVRASKDGHSVVCHDEDLVRIAGLRLKVSDLKLEELQAIELKNGGRLLTLAELLSQFADVKVNIDIKSADAIVPTMQAVKAAKASDRVLISSFSEARRRAAVKLMPEVASSASAIALLAIWLSWRLRCGSVFRRLLRDLDALQIPRSSGWLRFDHERFIGAVSRHGVEVHYWTINDPIVARELRARGARGIVSDRIDLIIAAFAE
jgi:glycerophosphoryl diester phosphodiesterase